MHHLLRRSGGRAHGGCVNASHAGGAAEVARRPESWRLACQALVQESVAVLTRPQAGRDAQKQAIAAAQAEPLPEGRMPEPEPVLAEGEDGSGHRC